MNINLVDTRKSKKKKHTHKQTLNILNNRIDNIDPLGQIRQAKKTTTVIIVKNKLVCKLSDKFDVKILWFFVHLQIE
jgi:hypothetical protein